MAKGRLDTENGRKSMDVFVVCFYFCKRKRNGVHWEKKKTSAQKRTETAFENLGRGPSLKGRVPVETYT